MIPVRYVWLTWAGLFVAVWLALFIACRRYRPLMWWSSLLSLPFGLSEPFFLMHYWHPPSLFNLTNIVHADLETFLFCFAIGGTAAVGYHVVTGQGLVAQPGALQVPSPAWYCTALAAPAPAFGAVLLLTAEIIWAGVAGFLAGTVGRLLSRPDLRMKTVFGGLVFLTYYALLLQVLRWMAPGYIDRAWNAQGPAAVRLFGVPLTELLFGLCFGMYWSGLLEQVALLFTGVATAPSSRGQQPIA